MPRPLLASANVSFGALPPAAVDQDGPSGVLSSNFSITCTHPARREVFTTRMRKESLCPQDNVGKICTSITTMLTKSLAAAVAAEEEAAAAPTPSSNVNKATPTVTKTSPAKKEMPTATYSSPAPMTIKIA